jgi:NADPH-dependent 2,4-dienoyl-CoA reductase/sulfur reductase-like enzyme
MPADLEVDVAVVGAGPAGLGAAAETTRAGLRTCLVDTNERVGGQYWRHGPGGPAGDPDLHHGVRRFDGLRSALATAADNGTLVHWGGREVWGVEVDDHGSTLHTVGATRPGVAARVHARHLLLATGAHELPVPFPGWDLPGVMSAGGAQALLKGSGVAVGPRVVVAGTGPFLLPVAAGLARRGAHVLGVHDANRPGGWLRRPGVLARHPAKLREAAGYVATLARHRTALRHGSVVLAAHGTDRLEAVTVARTTPSGELVPGSERWIETDVLAVGWGFVAQTDLAVLAACAVHAGPGGGVVVTVDDHQATTRPGVWAAGELTGVGGAALSEVEGRIAGLAVVRTAGRPTQPTATLRRRRDRAREFADAMHAVYPVPSHWTSTLDAATVVCRCEEVTVADLSRAVALGARDQRSAKLLSRAGMGLCQGRQCAYATGCLVAYLTGQPLEPDHGPSRPVVHPVRLDIVADGPIHP